MHGASAWVMPPSWTTTCSKSASEYTSNLAPSWPPSSSPNMLYYSLQLNLMSPSITASLFAWSWPPSVSPTLQNDSLQVHLQIHLITGFNYILKLKRLHPPCSHIHELHQLAGIQPSTTSWMTNGRYKELQWRLRLDKQCFRVSRLRSKLDPIPSPWF